MKKIRIIKDKAKTVTAVGIEQISSMAKGVNPFAVRRVYCLWDFTVKSHELAPCPYCGRFGFTTKPMASFRSIYREFV